MQNVIFIMLPSSTSITCIRPVYGLLFHAIYLSVSSCERVWHLNHRAGPKTYNTGSCLGWGCGWSGRIENSWWEVSAGGLDRGVISIENLWEDQELSFPLTQTTTEQIHRGQGIPGGESQWQEQAIKFKVAACPSLYCRPSGGKVCSVTVCFQASDWSQNKVSRLPGCLERPKTRFQKPSLRCGAVFIKVAVNRKRSLLQSSWKDFPKSPSQPPKMWLYFWFNRSCT